MFSFRLLLMQGVHGDIRIMFKNLVYQVEQSISMYGPNVRSFDYQVETSTLAISIPIFIKPYEPRG
jgi:hypothetical protein